MGSELGILYHLAPSPTRSSRTPLPRPRLVTTQPRLFSLFPSTFSTIIRSSSPSPRLAEPNDTIWPSATASGCLSRADATAYLSRLDLSPSLLDSPPSLSLLRTLHSTHMLRVPFESLSVHVPDWSDLTAPIALGGGSTVALGQGAYHRSVKLKRGGYCFSLNSSFASLLRALGYRVSECAGRVFEHQRKDPKEVGCEWECTSHQVSIVDWPSSEARYLVDMGFGRSCAFPIPLNTGATQTSIPSTDLFRLDQHDRLPGSDPSLLPDSAPYWVLSTRCPSPSGSISNDFYSPSMPSSFKASPSKTS
ncbi:hypothetical protein JCM11641_006631 [Rhodosporidiobolus odoratus]